MKFVRQIPKATLRHSPANVFEDYDIVDVICSICRFYTKSIAGTQRNPSFHLSLVTFDITTCSRERGGGGILSLLPALLCLLFQYTFPPSGMCAQ